MYKEHKISNNLLEIFINFLLFMLECCEACVKRENYWDLSLISCKYKWPLPEVGVWLEHCMPFSLRFLVFPPVFFDYMKLIGLLSKYSTSLLRSSSRSPCSCCWRVFTRDRLQWKTSWWLPSCQFQMFEPASRFHSCVHTCTVRDLQALDFWC